MLSLFVFVKRSISASNNNNNICRHLPPENEGSALATCLILIFVRVASTTVLIFGGVVFPVSFSPSDGEINNKSKCNQRVAQGQCHQLFACVWIVCGMYVECMWTACGLYTNIKCCLPFDRWGCLWYANIWPVKMAHTHSAFRSVYACQMKWQQQQRLANGATSVLEQTGDCLLLSLSLSLSFCVCVGLCVCMLVCVSQKGNSANYYKQHRNKNNRMAGWQHYKHMNEQATKAQNLNKLISDQLKDTS